MVGHMTITMLKNVDVLREVKQTMLKYDANYTIFSSYLNTDISRNTPHTASLHEFVNEYDMTICIEMGHVKWVMKHSHKRLIILLYHKVYVIILVNVLL